MPLRRLVVLFVAVLSTSAACSTAPDPGAGAALSSSLAAQSPVRSVFTPAYPDTNKAFVLTTETGPVPADAERRAVRTGPPPSGAITHLADIVELSDAPESATFTLMPYGGGTGCIATTTKRALVVRYRSTAGVDPSVNDAERLAVETGTLAWVVEGCDGGELEPVKAFAIPGAHRQARLLAPAERGDDEVVLVDGSFRYRLTERDRVLTLVRIGSE